MAGPLSNILIGGGFLIFGVGNQRFYIIPDDFNHQELDCDSEYEIVFEDDDNDEEVFFIISESMFEAAENAKNSKQITNITTSSYMIDRLDLFENNPIPRKSGNTKVKIGDRFLPIKRRDTMRTHFNIFKITLINTFYILRLEASLLSTTKLYRKEYTDIFDYREFTVFSVNLYRGSFRWF